MAYDFDKIARDYDRMNRLMTLGLDRSWRRIGTQAACLRSASGTQAACLRQIRKQAACVPSEYKVLDVACGTGDMCLLLAKQGFAVTGVDLSEEMMAIAKKKTAGWNLTYRTADAEHLPFGDGTFDAVTCAFGIRNFVHLEQGLKEMVRVLKPGGRMVILELSTPDSPLIRPFYNLYTRHIIPWLGKRIAGNREAYTYLPSSIERFPKGTAMMDKLKAVGGREMKHRKLTFGVCRCYILVK